MTHPVLARLADADPAERAAACRDAADDPAAVLLLDALGAALADPERRVAQAASDALARLATTAPEVGQVVRRVLRGDSESGRTHAAFTCARIEPPGPRIVPALVDALGSDDGDVRWAAARLLVNAGRAMGEILPLVLGLARGDERAWVRAMAVYCVRELAPDEPGAAQAVVDATRDPDVRVRHAAVTALAAFSGVALAIARLAEVADEPRDPAARRIAVFALGHVADVRGALPDAAVAPLRALSAPGAPRELRLAAERTLGRLDAAGADQKIR